MNGPSTLGGLAAAFPFVLVVAVLLDTSEGISVMIGDRGVGYVTAVCGGVASLAGMWGLRLALRSDGPRTAAPVAAIVIALGPALFCLSSVLLGSG